MDKQLAAEFEKLVNQAATKFNLSVESARLMMDKLMEEVLKPGSQKMDMEDAEKHFRDLFAKAAASKEEWAVRISEDFIGRASVVYMNAKSAGQDPATAISMTFRIPMDEANKTIEELKAAFKD